MIDKQIVMNEIERQVSEAEKIKQQYRTQLENSLRKRVYQESKIEFPTFSEILQGKHKDWKRYL